MSTYRTSLYVRCDELSAPLPPTARAVPLKAGWVAVYDRKCNEVGLAELHRLAAELSGAQKCLALALLEQDETRRAYALYSDGELADEVVTAGLAGGRVPTAGNPEALRRHCPQMSREEAEQLLAGVAQGPPIEVAMEVRARRSNVRRPEALQQLLESAAEQLKHTPPGMLRRLMSQMGFPEDDPRIAALLEDPAACLTSLSQDQEGLSSLSERLSAPPTEVGPLQRLAQAVGVVEP